MTRAKKLPKYVFVTGGVISGLGKGICTASTALLLKELGYKVTSLKVDMYLNIDAGTINPMEHGEVFVTEDGVETDQDLGNYERFLDLNFQRHNYMTMGQVYYDVITKERRLGYDGQDVEGHIHIPEEIIKRIKETAERDNAEIMFIEVGGTVGEYQNMIFFETIRRFKQQYPKNIFLIHLVYLPKPGFLGEIKSKPAQTSIYELYKLGLQPNFVICRSENAIDKNKKHTIAFNTGVKEEDVISAPDVPSVYEIPLVLKKQMMGRKLLKEMGLKPKIKPNKDWDKLIENIKSAKSEVKIAIVGKYFNFGESVLKDAYLCVIEAVKHASWNLDLKPSILWFDVERFEKESERKKIEKELSEVDGIIVPQGWGKRGVEGKIKVVQFARERKIPYLGLCFGMQMAVIEFARNILGFKNANSEEVNPKTKYPVIHIMKHQKKLLKEKRYGGTIRLGAYPCKLNKESILYKAYKNNSPKRITEVNNESIVQERHRHRYEFNNKYKKEMEKAGLIISGTSPDGSLVESVELSKDVHPFFVGTQFHPEYKSRPLNPHPIFVEFIKASSTNTKEKIEKEKEKKIKEE